MAERDRHVDLKVLQLVEQALSHEDEDRPADGDGELVPLPTAESPEREQAATHPAAHVPEQPLIAKQAMTPLARRR